MFLRNLIYVADLSFVWCRNQIDAFWKSFSEMELRFINVPKQLSYFPQKLSHTWTEGWSENPGRGQVLM